MNSNSIRDHVAARETCKNIRAMLESVTSTNDELDTQRWADLGDEQLLDFCEIIMQAKNELEMVQHLLAEARELYYTCSSPF